MQPTDNGIVEWVIGVLLAICGGILTVFRDLYRRVDGVRQHAASATSEVRMEAAAATAAARTHAEEGDKNLWVKVNQESEISRLHRESILTRIGDLPTKSDLTTMEGRLTALISKDKAS